MSKTRILFLLLFALLLAARLCHVEILWAEETLPLAAAQQMRAGKVLYRDIWFDKPPVAPVLCRVLGGEAGWLLRAAGSLYALLCCWIAFAFARDLWGEREGRWAAGLLGFFLIFDFPSSTIPLAADLLMLAPHMAAVWMAWKRRPLLAGALAGVAFAVSPKGLFVLAVCAWWAPSALLIAGFAAVTGVVSAWMWSAGALAGYWDEVWRWGRVYAGTTFVENPVGNGLVRTLNWAGFHAGIVVAAAMAWKEISARWVVWLGLSVIGVAAGLRFFPRYYFQILPVVVLLAARGLAQAPLRSWRAYVPALLLLVPLVRFAPTYFTAARGGEWRDTAMDRDSRAIAAKLKGAAQPGDTLFVWGYRPEIYVYSHLPAASRYLDSQPLTGVPADRHLTQSAPVEMEGARVRRGELSRTRPEFVVDGLGVYNPRLAIGAFEDLRAWMANYREIARSGQSVVYQRVR
uniref:Glycosyltransferase RgtA/B/C/D-like domain-containing protein n=1 Tax=Solibacter usitatus (strain Ellin6076) TaxID=234267 RepID=Q01Q00_SOLUE